jgi:hypothetical protein
MKRLIQILGDSYVWRKEDRSSARYKYEARWQRWKRDVQK